MSSITTIVDLPVEVTHELSADGTMWVMKKEYLIPYRAALKAQMDAWVAGNPIHCVFSNECCPDFSCCHPEGLWQPTKRKLFSVSSPEVQIEMMMGSLANAIEVITDAPVYISGTTPGPDETIH